MKRYSAMSVQYSRGCPFSCEFCDIIEIYGRVPRTKSNQQMLAEFDALRDLGWRGTVFIVDDNFIGNKKNVRTLLPELAKWQKANGLSVLTAHRIKPESRRRRTSACRSCARPASAAYLSASKLRLRRVCKKRRSHKTAATCSTR